MFLAKPEGDMALDLTVSFTEVMFRCWFIVLVILGLAIINGTNNKQ